MLGHPLFLEAEKEFIRNNRFPNEKVDQRDWLKDDEEVVVQKKRTDER